MNKKIRAIIVINFRRTLDATHTYSQEFVEKDTSVQREYIGEIVVVVVVAARQARVWVSGYSDDERIRSSVLKTKISSFYEPRIIRSAVIKRAS